MSLAKTTKRALSSERLLTTYLTTRRSNFFILVFLFASPIVVLYHSGLLFKENDADFAGLKDSKGGARSRHGSHKEKISDKTLSENRSHVENFNTNILVYNRVPKCGSIWMTRLLYLLGAGDQNNYNVESPYEPGEKPWLSRAEEQLVVSHLDETPKPSVYIRHQYFIDFDDHGKKRPLYMNVIRDPVEKFRSFYYFIRNGNLEGDGKDVVMSPAKKARTIDDCIKLQEKECTEPKWQLVPYFCGQDERCRKKSSWAVEKAKENIEKYYVMVGIVEELQSTLKVFELLMPRYFHGAVSIQSAGEEKIKNDTYTLDKKVMSKESAEFLRTQTSIALEYDLYNFVHSRFQEVKHKYNIE